ncbi:hypothetical protein HDU76_008579 [Blyttiomyces sp. JEL0837]|nr:hypothetical protein HDU76_008579 [Blyttiomyces sp. JEL0837]
MTNSGIQNLKQLAVNETNLDPSILPFTYINIKRFNSWDPENPTVYNYIDSGGAASVSALNAVNNGATVAIGECYSKTTVFSNEIFSYFKIPFCGIQQTTFQLSDKTLYPYYFRMLPGVGQVQSLVGMLQYLNVKRVAFVVGFDALSRSVSKYFERAVVEAGIQVLTKVTITAWMLQSHDYDLPYRTLKSSDARYILLFANQDTTTDFYIRAGNMSLISPKHVWFGFGLPIPEIGDITEIYGPDSVNLMQGYISTEQSSPDPDSPATRRFDSIWKSLMNTSPRFPSVEQFPGSYGENCGSYDCAKVMFLGLHQFLENNRQFTPEMLASGALNKYLVPSIFANTGYDGISLSPLTMDEYGDLNV